MNKNLLIACVVLVATAGQVQAGMVSFHFTGTINGGFPFPDLAPVVGFGPSTPFSVDLVYDTDIGPPPVQTSGSFGYNFKSSTFAHSLRWDIGGQVFQSDPSQDFFVVTEHVEGFRDTLRVQASYPTLPLGWTVSPLPSYTPEISLLLEDNVGLGGTATALGGTLALPTAIDLSAFQSKTMNFFFNGAGQETSLTTPLGTYSTYSNTQFAGGIETISTVVPEPTSLLIWSIGLVGMSLASSRRRRRSV